MKLNHYDILGVAPEATQEEIHKAYRRKAYQLHPDRHADKGEEDIRHATKAAAEVNEAWRILRDPVTRQIYDSSLGRQKALGRLHKGTVSIDWGSGPFIFLYLMTAIIGIRLVSVIGQEAIEVKLLWIFAVVAIFGIILLLWIVLRDMGR